MPQPTVISGGIIPARIAFGFNKEYSRAIDGYFYATIFTVCAATMRTAAVHVAGNYGGSRFYRFFPTGENEPQGVTF